MGQFEVKYKDSKYNVIIKNVEALLTILQSWSISDYQIQYIKLLPKEME